VFDESFENILQAESQTALFDERHNRQQQGNRNKNKYGLLLSWLSTAARSRSDSWYANGRRITITLWSRLYLSRFVISGLSVSGF
jgi:hypothetical protein